MKQSTCHDGIHLALVMDGNGRWASARGLPRTAGHVAGAAVVRDIVRAAPGLGVTTLTLFGFASANWRRPRSEVGRLMRIFRRFFREAREECATRGVRVSVIGRRDRIPIPLRREIEEAERATTAGARLHLRIAIDYSSRRAIHDAARSSGGDGYEAFAKAVSGTGRPHAAAPDVDLVVRTGGERRLSDFLLFESAQAELLFLDTPWPEFGPEELKRALTDFHARERRFGGLPAKAAS